MSHSQPHQQVGPTLITNLSEGARARGFATAPALQYAALTLLAAILFNDALATMIGQWITSSTYHHGFVVFPVAAWLIWRERAATAPPAPSLPAALVLIPLCAIMLAGAAAGAAIVQHLVFISMLITSFAVVFGVGNARRCAFGLLFLFMAAPFGESLKPALQALTAGVVAPLLAFSGVELDREGALIKTAAGLFEIADACAGLNFLLAAILVSAAFAGVAFRSWRKRLGFIAIAAAAALAANILRAYLVILLATKTPLGMDFARDHAAFGWALYAVFLFALVAAGRSLRDDWRDAGSALASPAAGAVAISTPVIAAAVIMIIAALTAALGVPAGVAQHVLSLYR